MKIKFLRKTSGFVVAAVLLLNDIKHVLKIVRELIFSVQLIIRGILGVNLCLNIVSSLF